MKARSLKHLIICLVTGILLTISITWYFAYRHDSFTIAPFDQRFRTHSDQPTWAGDQSWIFCACRIELYPANDIWYSDYPYMDGILPYWSRGRVRPSSEVFDDPRSPKYFEKGWGWPFICGTTFIRKFLYTSEGVQGPPNPIMPYEVVSGFRVADSGYNIPVPYRLLPIQPVYPGLIGNILCYSLFAYLVLFGYLDLRYIFRHKRGLCVKCAYDLRGVDHEACPECGAETPS